MSMRSNHFRLRTTNSRVLLTLLVLLLCLSTTLVGGVWSRAFAEPNSNQPLATSDASTTLMDVYGVSRAELVSWLQSHENDTYYLTTPYDPNDNRSPNGDINGYGDDSNNEAGMNCTGFVWHALCAAHGWRDDIASRLPALSGWIDAINNEGLETRDFSTKQDMLNSGYLEKGDIIWAWDGSMHSLSSSHHVGIFWGSSSSEDRMWHSEGAIVDGFWKGTNRITDIHGKAADPSYTVIKLGGSLYGSFKLKKVSAQPTITNDNACYSLQDARYGLFESAAKAQTHDENQAIAIYFTDSLGEFTSEQNIQVGTYYVAECSPPQGYALNSSIYPVTISPNQVTTVYDEAGKQAGTVNETPFSAPLTPLALKQDFQLALNEALGGATLENACFEVKYYDGYYSENTLPVRATRTWNLRTSADGSLLLDAKHKISGDEFYVTTDGSVCLPLGTYLIKEITPPLGYLCGSKEGLTPSALVKVEAPKNSSSNATYSTPKISDRVIRGDFSFTKVDGETGKHLGLIPFLVTSVSTGEQHVIVTDENGMASTASSWTKHSARTNTNDKLLTELQEGNRIPSQDIDTQSGIWFSGSAERACSVDDALGALPYDTYHVKELPCDTNLGYSLASFDVYITREGTLLNLGTVDDNPQAEPSLDTYLTHSDGLKLFTASDSTQIEDAIYYMNLDPKETYTIDGELRLVTEDNEGGDVVAQTQLEFSPVLPLGETRVTFDLDTSTLEGARLVAFETISDSNGVVLAVHNDPQYEAQTVYVDAKPEIPEEPDPEPEPEPTPDPEPDPAPKLQPEPEKTVTSTEKELPKMGDYLFVLPLIVIAVGALIFMMLSHRMRDRHSARELVIIKGPARSEFEEWYRSVQRTEDSRRSETPKPNFRF